MLKNVIFDIGNVLTSFDDRNYGSVYFKDKAMAEIMQEAINSYGLWERGDMGDRDPYEIIDEFAATVTGHEDAAREAALAASDYVRQEAYTIPWLKELKAAGYHVYYLSNYNKYLQEARPDFPDFIPYMDGGILSCDVHMLKPQGEIYMALLDKYDLKAEECIFIDDREINIEGGRAAGIDGIVFKNYEQAHAELRKRLGY